MAHGILKMRRPVYLLDAASVGGHEEAAGPLGAYLDRYDAKNDDFGQDTWEAAESEMNRLAAETLLSRAGLDAAEIGALFAGDLLNQCTGSGYGLLPFDIPYFGLYGACSTAAEGLALAAFFVDHFGGRAVSAASSHFCSAERQFRFPMEYGGQRTPTSQWTVTGAAAFLLGGDRAEAARHGRPVRIAEALPGITIDRGITDANNMGAAMAPAAADTILRYLRESGREPQSFDMIVTGDLGAEGASILCELCRAGGAELADVHRDCGLLIYDRASTDKHAGGSGCGCSALVLAGYLLAQLRAGTLGDILLVGTGALLSPMVVQQGRSIPGIAHLLHITTREAEP